MTTTLRNAAGRDIVTLHSGDDIDPGHAPRPFITVSTPGGIEVTETAPGDHLHHLGVSVTTPDVSGTNFWGGSTFVRDVGPQILDNHGRQVVEAESVSPSRYTATVLWRDRDDEPIISEEREIRVDDVDGSTILVWRSRLTALREGVSIGSSQTNGRPGAFYGGIFWRAPFGTAEVFSAAGEGVDAAHGSTSPWIVVAGPDASLVAASASRLPWFVRADGYVGFCPALAYDERRRLEPGEPLELDLVVALVDAADDNTIERALQSALSLTTSEVAA
ncbi:PmoA family protein [Microbacterium sorbitolivorans]|uniref:Oxidoreductase n=1 Tax=Microbacterium sorbitolivorans TaxID=1867410 RepID=A0A367Y8A6_9MICO|nr:PmoA family protein [Microbacterium sorbitolivorans]RCK62095.1 oxidoreductase [Microbacterium sorbitolivorans]